ncbi:MAG: phosphoglycerate kinase [Parcubacteria group bacterium]|nr:phosphoglycerate kinase [Parcubacteria group bacterium]|tara:strand:- start:5433 stop:6659 length:1227 start_codon:yes stop_codon:yes gene_type:complete
MKLKSIREVKKLKGKKVLLRVAYDVPLKKSGQGWKVSDDRRITETIPTINYLLKNSCKIVILSWLSRPDGKVVEKYKMDPVAKTLSKLINQPVKKLDDCVGPKVFSKIEAMESGEILMLENVRFYPEEMAENKMFSALLVHGLDLICFDAFGHAHRVHSSTTGITKLIPTYAGFLLDKEIKALSRISKKPKRPLVIVLGGAKISDKINTLKKLVKIADKVLIGGGLANVFLKALRVPIGNSFIEDVFVDKARRKKVNYVTLARKIYKRNKSKIVLPVDLVAGNKIDKHSLVEVVDFTDKDAINQRWKFLDIGPKTIKNYQEHIKTAKTIFFNGPMGVFEVDKFSNGTKKISQAVAKSSATTVIGGGDTEIVASKYRLEKKFNHISTGGGASMEFLAGKELPALKHIKK